MSGDTPFLNRFIMGAREDDLSYASRAGIWISEPDQAKLTAILNATNRAKIEPEKLKLADLPFTRDDDVSTVSYISSQT